MGKYDEYSFRGYFASFFYVLTNFLKGVDFIIEKIKFPVLYLLIGYESVLMLLP